MGGTSSILVSQGRQTDLFARLQQNCKLTEQDDLEKAAIDALRQVIWQQIESETDSHLTRRYTLSCNWIHSNMLFSPPPSPWEDETELFYGPDCTDMFEQLDDLTIRREGDNRDVIVVFHNFKGCDGMFVLQYLFRIH